jgi:formate/nitrite transporter FocA (FNT family)
MVECNVSHSAETLSRHFLIPTEIVEKLVAVGQHKAANTPIWKTLLGALMAGFYVTFGGMAALTAAGGLDPAFSAKNPSVAKILTGLTFWIALLLIMTLGGELFTGNLMYVSLARLHGRCTTLQMLTNWGIVFWGNFAACVLGAYVLAFHGDLYASEPWRSYVQAVAMHKVELSWGAVVCRGIGANWMVCAVRYVMTTAIFPFGCAAVCPTPIHLSVSPFPSRRCVSWWRRRTRRPAPCPASCPSSSSPSWALSTPSPTR